MAIDPDALLALELPTVLQDYSAKDATLYALGLGLGSDPLDEKQLRFADITRSVPLPSLATVIGHPGFWMRDLECGIDWVNLVHGEHELILHQAFPSQASTRSTNRVVEVVDKGPGRGALVMVQRDIYDAVSGAALATQIQTVFCRNDGGFGGTSVQSRKLAPTPETPPDQSVILKTTEQTALIYALSGDHNPIHIDPQIAAKAGFERPILHGLASFGAACAGLVISCCEGDPARFRAMRSRFTAPVYPGETLRLDLWRTQPGKAAFAMTVLERDVRALSHGSCEFVERS